MDLDNWILRTSPKLTTGVKYQFHKGFWPDQGSGNPGAKSAWDFRISDLVKSLMELIFNPCGEFR